ncbi:MAG: hypothetical protein ABSD45_12935 [Terriglobia bacterium]
MLILRADQILATHSYLLGLKRRNRKDTWAYLQQAEAQRDWQECPAGIASAEKAVVPRTRVVEVAGKEPGVRVFVVHSKERERYERSLRELSMERVRKELEALEARVEKGELKKPDKIAAAAATVLRRHHGHRYFDWEWRQGKFRFFEHTVNGAREKALEGKYVIQSEERNLLLPRKDGLAWECVRYHSPSPTDADKPAGYRPPASDIMPK